MGCAANRRRSECFGGICGLFVGERSITPPWCFVIPRQTESEGPVVLFVGRLAKGKRPWLTVDAFSEVHNEHPDAELYLCGDGPLRGEIYEQVRKLGIGNSVTFLGHVPNEMPKVYRSGDGLMLTGRTEGLPQTVM